MTIMRLLLLGLLALAVPAAALSQSARPAASSEGNPATAPDEPTTVEELVVRGRLPGPAWWRVTQGEATVFILGLPEALPDAMAWDQSLLAKRLQGADRLITPPAISATINPFMIFKLLWDINGASRSKTPLARRLPASLLARLDAAAVRIGGSADDYRNRPTWVAGLRLAIDHDRRVGLTSREPLHTIRAAARRADVEVAPAHVTSTRASSLVDEIKAIPETAGQACLEAAVADVEQGEEGMRAVAAAWAKGDLRVVLHRRRPFPLCLEALKSVREDRANADAQEVQAVKDALAQPGHSVAAFPLRSLVARGGVLSQLRDQGFTVRAPE